MKHIKGFKIFENKEFAIPESVKEEIKDILFDLGEEGYTITYNLNTSHTDIGDYAYISIMKYLYGNRILIRYSEIYEYVKRLNIYLEDEGLKIVVYKYIFGNMEITNKNEESTAFTLRIYKIDL